MLVSPCKDVALPISAVLYRAFDSGPDYARRERLVSGVDYTIWNAENWWLEG